jgi:hypothetical protein
MQALRRSRELARGKLWRNFGVLLLVSIPVYLAIFLVAGVLGIITVVLESGGFADWLLVFATRGLLQLMIPPIIVAIVLLYYDMRARKEAFDSTALAQELMH